MKGLEVFFVSASTLHTLNDQMQQIKDAYTEIIFNKKTWRRHIPVIHFYGFNNQYHRWMFGDAPWFGKAMPGQSKGFVRKDFGISYQDMRPVASVLWDALKWTLILSFVAIFITYLIAIPIGIRSAVTKGSWEDRLMTTFLFILYSLPSFWIATLLIMFLGGGDYLDWFPAYGVGDLPASAPFIDRFMDTAYHLVLPILCLVYPTFAFLSRQMRGGMLTVLNQDYIRTARAKGLSKRKVVWKHSFRNALLPIITLFANVFFRMQ